VHILGIAGEKRTAGPTGDWGRHSAAPRPVSAPCAQAREPRPPARPPTTGRAAAPTRSPHPLTCAGERVCQDGGGLATPSTAGPDQPAHVRPGHHGGRPLCAATEGPGRRRWTPESQIGGGRPISAIYAPDRAVHQRPAGAVPRRNLTRSVGRIGVCLGKRCRRIILGDTKSRVLRLDTWGPPAPPLISPSATGSSESTSGAIRPWACSAQPDTRIGPLRRQKPPDPASAKQGQAQGTLSLVHP
jgi:hypothetical protein